jgi:hypothetical protein
LSASVREAFSAARILDNLDVETAEVLFGTMPSPYLNTGAEFDPMRTHEPEAATPMRAHDRR